MSVIIGRLALGQRSQTRVKSYKQTRAKPDSVKTERPKPEPKAEIVTEPAHEEVPAIAAHGPVETPPKPKAKRSPAKSKKKAKE